MAASVLAYRFSLRLAGRRASGRFAPRSERELGGCWVAHGETALCRTRVDPPLRIQQGAGASKGRSLRGRKPRDGERPGSSTSKTRGTNRGGCLESINVIFEDRFGWPGRALAPPFGAHKRGGEGGRKRGPLCGGRIEKNAMQKWRNEPKKSFRINAGDFSPGPKMGPGLAPRLCVSARGLRTHLKRCESARGGLSAKNEGTNRGSCLESTKLTFA